MAKQIVSALSVSQRVTDCLIIYMVCKSSIICDKMQTAATALQTAMNCKYHQTRSATCQYQLPSEWWFHICGLCILSIQPCLSLSGDGRVNRMHNETGEYIDHLIPRKPPPHFSLSVHLTGWLVIWRLVGLFVDVNNKQCGLTVDEQAVNLRGRDWPSGVWAADHRE